MSSLSNTISADVPKEKRIMFFNAVTEHLNYIVLHEITGLPNSERTYIEIPNICLCRIFQSKYIFVNQIMSYFLSNWLPRRCSCLVAVLISLYTARSIYARRSQVNNNKIMHKPSSHIQSNQFVKCREIESCFVCS